nr:hypothetical protein [Tanacetum cinerariifolium]
MDSNPSQSLVLTHVDTGMHKEDHQTTHGPTSLGVTSEARANPQLSSGMSAFNLYEPIYSASFIIHSESASGNDASAASTVEADPGNFAPSDFVPQQHVITTTTTQIQSPSLQPPPKISSQPKRGHIKEDKGKKALSLEEANKKSTDNDSDDETYVTGSMVEPFIINKLKNLLPTELKDLPSKFNELTEEVKGLKKQVHELEIELPRDLKEILTKLERFAKTVASVQVKLKTLDTLPGLLLNVTKALNKFAQVLDYASSKARDQSVPSADQADTRPTEGEKDTNQPTISKPFIKKR